MSQKWFSASMRRLIFAGPTAIAIGLGLGWAAREKAIAAEKAERVASQTVSLDQVKMKTVEDGGRKLGDIGIYVDGDTPGSTKFVTGRFVIAPHQTPHAPHQHDEEEVMVIESGTGEIFNDGKTTKVGPGSVMYTTPQASHGILNTGDTPLTFYFIKWANGPSK